MSRDMQVGLLLVVGFIALVGGVLYYRIEHPDELENYLQGSSTQAKATEPLATSPGVLANTGVLPAAPTTTSPSLDNVNTFQDKSAQTVPGTVPSTSPVTLTSGSTTSDVARSNSTSSNANPPLAMGAPALAMVALDDKKPVTTEPKKTETATRSSLPEPPASTTNIPPPGTAPAISLNVDGNSSLNSSLPETKKPVDTSARDGSKLFAPFALAAGVVMSDSGKSSEKKSEELPQPPGLPQSAPSLGANSAAATGNSNVMPPPGFSGAPNLSNPPALASNTPGNATPPISSVPVPGGMNLPTTPTGPLSGSSTPNTNTQPVMSSSPILNTNVPSLNTNAPSLNANAPSLTTNAPSLNTNVPATNSFNGNPETVVKPNQGASPLTASVERGLVDNDNMRVYPPRVGLGKPMTESEAQSRERRWAETAGSPPPIVPSSAASFGGSGVSAPASTASDRRVVRDTYIPTERALRGETFSSLSQRLYGDTNYAAALTAFNKEEGFVKMDQPEPNEWVAKPNREILDQRYPHLIRKLTPTTFNPNTVVNQVQNSNRNNATASAANYQTYRVGKGEQLFEVAKKTLGDGYRWSEIYALNKDQLRDSTELRPDMVLKIPTGTRK